MSTKKTKALPEVYVTPLESFSDEDLVKEIDRLKKEAKRRADVKVEMERVAHEARYGHFYDLLDKDMDSAYLILGFLAPEHGRTSCSDEALSNGFGSNGLNSPPRCIRCALLQIFKGYDYMPFEFELVASIDKVR